MPTVVNPNREDIYRQQQMQSQEVDDLQSVLEAMNQRKHQMEQQQREMQYNFMNQYAASHGGWANVAAQPGGDQFVGEYLRNIGYEEEMVPGVLDAIKQGYNPDEAAYAIRRQNMFPGGAQQQQQRQPQQRQPQPQQQTGGGAQFRPGAVEAYLQPQPQEEQTEKQTEKKQPDASSKGEFVERQEAQGGQNTQSRRMDYQVPDRGRLTGPLPRETAPEQSGRVITRGGISTGETTRQSTSGGFDVGDYKSSTETTVSRADQQELTEGREQTQREQQPEEAPDPEVQQQVNTLGEQIEGQIEYLTADTLRSNRNLFPDGKIPDWEKMTPKQKKAYQTMKSYYQTKASEPGDVNSIVQGAREVFNTIAKSEQEPSKGKRKASAQQIKNRGKKVMEDLQVPESIADFYSMSRDEIQEYRARLDWLQENRPQQWAATFGSELQAAKELKDMEYKDALVAAKQARTAIAREKWELQKQAAKGDQKAAQNEMVLTLLETFMNNPKLAERDEFKDMAESVGALGHNIIASMVGPAKGTGQQEIFKRLEKSNPNFLFRFLGLGRSGVQGVFPQGNTGVIQTRQPAGADQTSSLVEDYGNVGGADVAPLSGNY